MITFSHKGLKHFTILLFTSCCYISAYAQDPESITIEKDLGIVITQQGNVSNLQPYLVAFKKANMGSYRFLDARRTLKFDTGLEIELLSAQELNLKYGTPIKSGLVKSEDFTENMNVVFILHSSGNILEKHKPVKIK